MRFTLRSQCGFTANIAYISRNRHIFTVRLDWINIYSSTHTTVMSMISSMYTALVLIISINLLIHIAFTVWITLKHKNNIVDNERRMWSGYTVTDQHKTIHQHHSQYLEASGLKQAVIWWGHKGYDCHWTSTLRWA